MKNFSIEIPILNDEQTIVVCWGSRVFLDKIASEYGYEKRDIRLIKGSDGTTIDSPENYPIILLSREPKTAEDVGTLAHEAIHAMDFIFENIGESKKNEVFAYSVGAIVRKVLEQYE